MACVDGTGAVSLVERFVLCAINGTSTFAISLVSAIQMNIVETVSGSGFTSEALELHRVNLEKYKTCMKSTIFSVLEMIIFPTTFALLNAYLALSVVCCILGCIVAMSCTCIALRASGIVSGCTSLGAPVYPNGYPFPSVLVNNSAKKDIEVVPKATSKHIYNGPMCKGKAFVMAFLFVPLRMVTMGFSLVLMATRLVLLPIAVLSDLVDALAGMGMVTPGCTEKPRPTFEESSKIAGDIRSLAYALCYDAAWILSLGAYGVGKIMYASTYAPKSTPPVHKGSGGRGGGCCVSRANTEQQSNSSQNGGESLSGFVQDVESMHANRDATLGSLDYLGLDN